MECESTETKTTRLSPSSMMKALENCRKWRPHPTWEIFAKPTYKPTSKCWKGEVFSTYEDDFGGGTGAIASTDTDLVVGVDSTRLEDN
jgi:hypothetical protein